MSSSLFRASGQQSSRGNSIFGGLGQINDVVRMLKSGNPQEFAENLIKTNPEFARFYEANKDKSVEQLLRDNGVKLDTIMQLLK